MRGPSGSIARSHIRTLFLAHASSAAPSLPTSFLPFSFPLNFWHFHQPSAELPWWCCRMHCVPQPFFFLSLSLHRCPFTRRYLGGLRRTTSLERDMLSFSVLLLQVSFPLLFLSTLHNSPQTTTRTNTLL